VKLFPLPNNNWVASDYARVSASPRKVAYTLQARTMLYEKSLKLALKRNCKMKAILDTKPTSGYDDEVSEHYHFPRRYLSIIERCIGDWVILRRPRADGGNLAYFAAAKIGSVDADPQGAGMSYARYLDFLNFDEAVPWRSGGRYAEKSLRDMPQRQVGVYLRGRSVRPLTDDDFADLILRGLSKSLDAAMLLRIGLAPEELDPSNTTTVASERVRRIEQVLTNRLVRDAGFRRSVCEAYGHRCAVTRLKVLDAAGNSEVQAAHIWSVAQGGPDVIGNGVALSATIHWLFDSYLISLSDECELLIDTKRVPAELQETLRRHGEVIALPQDKKHWPHPSYISKHRSIFLEAVSDKRL
jgi:putative restriction endonuclease